MSASRANVVVGVGVAGAVVAGAVVVSQGGDDGGGDPPTVATFTFPSSDALPVDMFHFRRGLVGGTLARSAFAVTQGGTCYAASISHGGSRANPVTWDSDFAGCTHAFAALAAGDQTCAAVATAAAAALTTAGATGVAAVGCDVTVADATSIIIGRPRSMSRDEQGVWGIQRDLTFAGGGATGGVAIGTTIGVHLNPRCNGRIIAACVIAGGNTNVRIGIGEGPDYAADPTAIAILAEGVAPAIGATRPVCIVPTDPVAVATTDDTWIVARAPGTVSIRRRAHGATPVGNSDLVVGESIIWSALTGDSTIALGASVDIGGGGGPFAYYGHVFYVDECAASGTYPGDGAIDEWIGFQPELLTDVTLTSPATMANEVHTYRYPAIPWSDIQLTQIRQHVGARTAGDDLGVAVYSWDVADIFEMPSASAAVRLANLGPFGVTTANAFNTHTLATPLNVGDTAIGDDSIALAWNCGRAGGAAATTLQFAYNVDAFGGSYCSLTHWESNGRQWSDFCDSQGHGTSTEYQSSRPNGSAMQFSDPTLVQPNPFAIDSTAPTDTEPLDVPRQAIRIVRTGITGVVE